mgnify:CR=1 FL=1
MTGTVLVTGGSRGIGRAVSEVLNVRGWQVLAPSRQELDLADASSVGAFLSSLTTEVDGLVLNAGVNSPRDLGALSFEEWNKVHQVNETSAFQLVSGLVPMMAQRGRGRLVAITSAYTARARDGRAAYSSSKSGLEALMRSVAVEYSGSGVIANSVAPGFVDTDLTRQNNTDETIMRLLERVPVGRLAEPKEIAEAVAFLMSDDNRYITGHTLNVDGGFACT